MSTYKQYKLRILPNKTLERKALDLEVNLKKELEKDATSTKVYELFNKCDIYWKEISRRNKKDRAKVKRQTRLTT